MYIGSTGLSGLHHLRLRGGRQRRRRGHGRVCHPHRRDPAGRRRLRGRRRRSRHPGRQDEGPKLKGMPAVQAVLTILHAGGKFGEADGGYKVSGGLHGVGVSVVNALLDPARVRGRPRRRAPLHRLRQRRQAATPSSRRSARHRVAAPAPPSGSGPTPPSSKSTEFRTQTLLERFQMMAFLNQGLEIRFKDLRPGGNPEPVDLPVRQRHHRLRQARQRVEGARCSRSPATSTRPTRTTRRSRSRSSGTPATTPTASTPSPTASPPSRAACTRRASRRRSPTWSTSTPATNLLKEKDDKLQGRGHP